MCVHAATKAIWICKPSDSSRGRNIFLIRELTDLVYDQQYLVQKYIDRPLTIGGYKLDLRLYVLVVSFHPMQVYMFQNGLVRFGTEKYDANPNGDLTNMYSHLTNRYKLWHREVRITFVRYCFLFLFLFLFPQAPSTSIPSQETTNMLSASTSLKTTSSPELTTEEASTTAVVTEGLTTSVSTLLNTEHSTLSPSTTQLMSG